MKTLKLLIEENFQEIELVKENIDPKKKDYYIQGIFMQGDLQNKNGRVYPCKILEREVNRYNDIYVRTKRALGELNHPESPNVNPERASHYVTELKMEGPNVFGKAKIIKSNPVGKIVIGLLDEGISLGVSSRGLGSLIELSNGIKEVQDDFQLQAIDIVSDPSAPGAFVQCIHESKEWIYEGGVWKEALIEKAKKAINKISKKNSEQKILQIFEKFINKI